MQAKSFTIWAALALLVGASVPAVTVAISDTSEALDEALRLKPRLDHGTQLFETCAACHGADGWGASDGSTPAIAGEFAPILLKEIVEFRYDARYSIRMQHFVDRHHLASPQDLADVAAYVQSLPPRQPDATGQSPPAGDGASVFANFCASCHGSHAQGNWAKRVPRLAAQHAEYLQEQMHDAAEGRRPGIGSEHARLLARLTSDDIDAIANYLAALPPMPPVAHDAAH